MEKYKILKDDSKIVGEVTLYRIQANVDIDWHGIKAGDLGGYIESVRNLNQYDNSWIDSTSVAMGDGYVYDNAILRNNSVVMDSCTVFNEAVMNQSIGKGNSMIYGQSWGKS